MKNNPSTNNREIRIEELNLMSSAPESASPPVSGNSVSSYRNWWRGSRFSHVVWRKIREEIDAVDR
jgi:hypothetical protein